MTARPTIEPVVRQARGAIRARLLAAAIAMAWMGATPGAGAAGLADTWRAAAAADPEAAAARLQARAAQAQRAQADAMRGPSVILTAAAGAMSNETAMRGARFSAPGFGQSDGVAFGTSVNPGAVLRWNVAARQPLFNRELDAQIRQLRLGADARDAELQAADQSLMLRTAERWFDVVLAHESLRVLEGLQAQAERSLSEVRDRYRLGDSPVTGTHEANARARAVGAQVLAARAQLDLARAAVADLTGLPVDAAVLRMPGGGLALPPEVALDPLHAVDAHPMLRAQALAVEAARQEAVRHASGSAPVADLVATAGRDRLSGHGDFGSAGNSQSSAMLGVQVTVPLYTGGLRDARRDEAGLLAERAAALLERTRLALMQQARAAWTGLVVGAARVDALEQALDASQARLDATRLGQEVGDRTTMDLLNAQNDLAQAQLALSQARIARLLDRLRLRAATGSIDEAVLVDTDARMRDTSGR